MLESVRWFSASSRATETWFASAIDQSESPWMTVWTTVPALAGRAAADMTAATTAKLAQLKTAKGRNATSSDAYGVS